jgi:hypothetical protein
MTTLLIQTESVPLTVNLPAIESMTVEQFYEFCRVNRDLRIERTSKKPPLHRFVPTLLLNFGLLAILSVACKKRCRNILTTVHY